MGHDKQQDNSMCAYRRGWNRMSTSPGLAVNSEKTMFMKRKGKEWIMHGLFVDDMAQASTCPKLKKQILQEYKKDFDITEEDIMVIFLGMEVEQSKDSIKLHLVGVISRHISRKHLMSTSQYSRSS